MSQLELVVRSLHDDGPVRTLSLARPDGAALPAYVPGSHLVLDCDGRANAYSLLDDGITPSCYRVSVLHQPNGRGGSDWMHRRRVGDRVPSALPRSAFAPVANASHHLLIAAGIGITPLLSHARAARRWGRSFTLLYRHARGAHLAELAAVSGPDLENFTERASFADRLATALVEQPLGAHLYVCGPAAFTSFVLDAATAAGWPPFRQHCERFHADVLEAGRPFRVRAGGRVHDVAAGVSLLEVLEHQGFSIPNRCRQGVCGECLIPLKTGRVEHRDLYLSEDERAANDRLLPCVSRARDEDLEVML